MATLFIIKGADEGKQVDLTEPVLTVGRDSNNLIRLHDTEVSRRHAEFRQDGNEYKLVDVGSANSMAGLRALWRGLLKSRANAPLAELRPIIVIREGSGGLGMQLRLVAGPLRDAAAAAKICAAMTENKRSCDTAIFDGQRLSMDANEPSPASRPAPSRKRGAAKRAAVAEPARKPETTTAGSTIASFFGRKNNQ